ncbi:MAG: hypothetical protein Q9219_003091 [cf. Caloplaca sp. 3 TL-2023]
MRSDEFNVDLPFLLQQAAWLYERQLSQVKAQLRKVSKPSLTAQSPTPSSVSGSGVAGAHAMARTSSGGARVPSSLAMRQRERPISQGESSPAGFSPPARGARMSRNSSTNTVYQVPKASPKSNQQMVAESPPIGTQCAKAREASRRLSDVTPKDKPSLTNKAASLSSHADDSSSDSSESDAAPSLSRSRAYLRRPRHSASKAPLGPLSDADEDEPDSLPFLPFSDLKATKQSSPMDPSATLRMAQRAASDKPTPAPPPMNSSSSSAQSQAHKPSRPVQDPRDRIASPRSPNVPASALSPRQRKVVKDGSDGTPSMGSSFSDLDDASVTQSALEEALAHEMNQGGVAKDDSLIKEATSVHDTRKTKHRDPRLTVNINYTPTENQASESSPRSSSDGSQMGRKSPRPRRQDSDRPTATAVGDQNGHASGSMDSQIELRRKHPSLESSSPSSQTTRLMSRDDFSLNEKPPLTPTSPSADTSYFDLPRQDRRNFLLLVLLYFLQGIPMGLAGGSVPFLLKSHLSYGQIGVFSLASYPYSLKLLWSPIVDAVWSTRLGRRKSWILPIQTFSGIGMIYLGSQIKDMMVSAGANDGSGVWSFTGWWFFLVFLCATQDIAVDGWAITLLSSANLSYASTAQTVGLTAGHFLSYTVFLAFNSPDFANRWFRSTPTEVGVMTLGGYLTFWGWFYLFVTLGLAMLKREDKTKDKDSIMEVYRSMVGILKLKNIQSIIIVHLIAKIGFQANDGVTNLKLLDKGFSQEDLALTVLIDFPFEISLGYYAGRWSSAYPAMHVWCWAFIGRLVAAVLAQGVVMLFPKDGVQTWYLLTVIASHIFSTFTNTVMFVAISAFHAKISDPLIGGTYMTLLATVSNLGGTFPRFFILKLVDAFTVATCHPPSSPPLSADLKADPVTSTFSCALEAQKHRCLDGGGTCIVERDGYYITNVVCVIIGLVTFWAYIRPAAMKLQALPLRAWRLVAGEDGR